MSYSSEYNTLPRIALVAIAKDESKALLEWVAYYLDLGFDAIHIYDNESADETPNLLKSLSLRYPVYYQHWKSKANVSAQVTAYNHFLCTHGGQYDWVAFFDLDEFLVLKPEASLKEVLSSYPERVGAVGVNWITLGSSDVVEDDYAFTTLAFTWGPKLDHGNNRHIKTLLRPSATDSMVIHHCNLKDGYHYVHADETPLEFGKKKGISTAINLSVLRLYHYQLKSHIEFEKKISRGRAGKRINAPDRVRKNPEVLFNKLNKKESQYLDVDTEFLLREPARSVLQVSPLNQRISRLLDWMPLLRSVLPNPKSKPVPDHWVSLVRDSGLFDTAKYLHNYPDILAAGVDPVIHYLMHGWHEGRIPSQLFDTEFYLAQLPNQKTEVAPLLHYLVVGQRNGLKPRLSWSTAPWWWTLQVPFEIPDSAHLRWQRLRQLDWPAIMIPVFNAVDAVEKCLRSVLKHSDPKVRIIVINDASTDQRIRPLLDHFASQSLSLEVYNHGLNQGYTATVNEGITLAGQADVVLLNSDTEVSAGWLIGLMWTASSVEHCATVTPFSDNAGAFSAPHAGLNALPHAVSLDVCARAVMQAARDLQLSVPTGSGFCLWMSRRCLNAVGLFDQQAFPRGYGEENDYCMRAQQAGWSHLVCDSVYVKHQRSASFGDEKRELLASGRAIVDARYPHYAQSVRDAFSADAFVAARKQVGYALQACEEITDRIQPRVLYVISTRTGGTPQTNQDLMTALAGQLECFVLHSDARQLRLEHFREGVYAELATYTLQQPIEAFPHSSDEYDAVVAYWMMVCAIECVHIRHIAWHGLGLPQVAVRLGIPCVFSFHDFYTLCPTVKLLDEQQRFCAGTCTQGEGICRHELWPDQSFDQLKHGQIHQWRQMFEAALAHCSEFITTSEFVMHLIRQHYPALRAKPFQVIPHGRDFDQMPQLARPPRAAEPLRVVIPGNISAAKGGLIIKQLAMLTPPERLEIHILGKVAAELELPQWVVQHGTYQRDTFADRIREIRPHMGAVLSIWPETWCHTLTELWASGVPVIAFDIGAVGDRIREHGGGWLVDPNCDIENLWACLQLAFTPDQWQAKVQAVQAWQLGEGHKSTCSNMALAYYQVYQSLVFKK